MNKHINSYSNKQITSYLNSQCWAGYSKAQLIRRGQAALIDDVLEKLFQLNAGCPQVVVGQVPAEVFNHISGCHLADFGVHGNLEELEDERLFEQRTELQRLKVRSVCREFTETIFQLVNCTDGSDLTSHVLSNTLAMDHPIPLGESQLQRAVVKTLQ